LLEASNYECGFFSLFGLYLRLLCFAENDFVQPVMINGAFMNLSLLHRPNAFVFQHLRTIEMIGVLIKDKGPNRISMFCKIEHIMPKRLPTDDMW